MTQTINLYTRSILTVMVTAIMETTTAMITATATAIAIVTVMARSMVMEGRAVQEPEQPRGRSCRVTLSTSGKSGYLQSFFSLEVKDKIKISFPICCCCFQEELSHPFFLLIGS